MKLFATATELSEAKERIGALELALATAESAAKDFEAQLTAAKADLAAAITERDAAKAALAEANAKVVDLTAKLTAKDAEVQTALAGVQTQVAAQAAATVAALGHQPVKIKADSAEDFLAAYAAETDPVKKAQMWKENRKKIASAFTPVTRN